jgi:hypothetical protein
MAKRTELDVVEISIIGSALRDWVSTCKFLDKVGKQRVEEIAELIMHSQKIIVETTE